MQTTLESLNKGFEDMGSYWVYRFGDGYELCFESLLYDEQMYVALYKNKVLLVNKVAVKPGKL